MPQGSSPTWMVLITFWAATSITETSFETPLVTSRYFSSGVKSMRQDAARQLEAGDGRQVDVDDAEIGLFRDERPLAAFGIRRFEQRDLGIVGEHGATARSDDGMIINNQNAHGVVPATCIDSLIVTSVCTKHSSVPAGCAPRARLR